MCCFVWGGVGSDGVADVALPLMLMVDADGDGISDGVHEDKLGLYEPIAGLTNGRPVYESTRNNSLLIWWSGGRWYLGKRRELGRNRGWLKVQGDGATPPETGWLVYSNKEWALPTSEPLAALG